ncbi:MAG: dihydroorotase [Flavobacteriales bacterium]|jgi:dihydroorotase|nr:dihydroorotase [Flavobacteriales bacterium]
MSALLLRQVKIVDPGGPHHDRTTDIRVEHGRIARIGDRIPKGGAVEVHRDGLCASPGWVDLRAHFRDPGEEWKQGIANGLDAAAAGGYTAVAVLPSTTPATDGRAAIEYMLRKATGHPVALLPLGAITKGLAGQELAELHDQRLAGAVAFSDDQHTIRNSRLMLLALQYVQGLPAPTAPVMVFPNDPDLGVRGMMHEGPMSTRLGLRGLPAMAEHIQLARDLALLEYAGGHLHAATVSTRESVELVRRAKAAKLRVTASVAAHHLLLDDGCLRGFETAYKVMPPLRDRAHIDALREGVKDGTIDVIVSDHRPEDREHKVVEFGQAAFGIIGLETAFAVANTAMKAHLGMARLVHRFTHGPRAVLGLPRVHIAEAGRAEITLFDPEVDWTCTEHDLVSRSHNTPFIGQPLTGRPIGIVAGDELRLAPHAAPHI